MLIDSHCHLHDRDFYSADEAEKCLVRAREAEVGKIICIGTSHEDSLSAREFADGHTDVYWTYGVHPGETGKSEFTFSIQAIIISCNPKQFFPTKEGLKITLEAINSF